MEKIGKVIWRVYLALMVGLLLCFAANFLGTPWGYIGFYARANVHLNQFFGEGARVTAIGFDFKGQSYNGAASYERLPGVTFGLDEVGEKKKVVNSYHTALWREELTGRFQPAYPEFVLHFVFAHEGGMLPRYLRVEEVPSAFEDGSAEKLLDWISVTVPADAEEARLCALVAELDDVFTQTEIIIYCGEGRISLDWIDREAEGACAQVRLWLEGLQSD